MSFSKHPLAHRVVTSHCPQRPFYRCTIQWSIGAETFCYNTHTHTQTQCWECSWWHRDSRRVLCCAVTKKLRARRPRKGASSSTRSWNCFPSNSVRRWSVVHTAYHQIRTESSSPGIKQPGRESEHSPPSSAGVNNRWIYMSTPTYVWTARFLIKHNEDLYLDPLPSTIYCRLQTDSPACRSSKPYRNAETADRSELSFYSSGLQNLHTRATCVTKSEFSWATCNVEACILGEKIKYQNYTVFKTHLIFYFPNWK